MSNITKWLDDLIDGLTGVFLPHRESEIEEIHVAKMAASAILYKIIVINAKQEDQRNLFYRFYKSEFNASDEELDSIYKEALKIQGTDSQLMELLNSLLNKHKNLKLQIITHMNNYAQLQDIEQSQRKMFEQAVDILSSFED